jgi:sodium transport system permease protein
MRWPNVWTIFHREVRDQLRDRRTLFMIFVVPILLYPILGMGAITFYVASEDKPQEVIVLGAENLPPSPALLNSARDAFSRELTGQLGFIGILHIRVEPPDSPWADPETRKRGIRERLADAVLEIPKDITDQLNRDHSANMPIHYLSTDERSQLTYYRLREILGRWNEKIVQGRLAKVNKAADYLEPVQMTGTDLATASETGGTLW